MLFWLYVHITPVLAKDIVIFIKSGDRWVCWAYLNMFVISQKGRTSFQNIYNQGATDMIIGIGRYIGIGRFIGIADMRNAYRYRLSVSADKIFYIGSLTDTV